MLVSNNVEKPKLLMKDLFNLKRKHDSNKIDFNTQTRSEERRVGKECGS